MSIHILSAEVADQIAAGEVVERPASVVKELVENAVDAGATDVSIYIEKGGKSVIEVRDNGMGMSQEDAEKCILRHATSKIQSIDDIFSIRSFGFRGEALAAISSVSHFRLITKKEDASIGILLDVSAGKKKDIVPTSANTGTQIKITDLFYPTPARLEYLKTEETEYRAIYKEIICFALSHSEIGFKFFKDGNLVFDYPAASQSIDRIQKILKFTPSDLLEVDQSFHGIKLGGYIGRPEKSAKTKTLQYIFINGRRIEDYRLSYAVREAYLQSCGIEKHLHPIFVLFLTIDPVLVDVNVHPRKLEVKFSDPQDVYSAVKSGVIQALGKVSHQSSSFNLQTSNRSFTNHVLKKSSPSATNQFNAEMFRDRGGFSQRHTQREFQSSNFNLQASENCIRREEVASSQEIRLIGQLANKYILAESNEGFFVFDQHALHERQRFERLLREAQSQEVHVQKLLIPEILEMPETEVSYLKENIDTILQIGFQIAITASSVEVYAVPILLAKTDLKELLEDFVNYFQNHEIGEHSLEKLLREILERRSCRGSVMFGNPLNQIEMQKLLDDFDSTNWKLLCPHGRPNHLFFSFNDLDSRFHR